MFLSFHGCRGKLGAEFPTERFVHSKGENRKKVLPYEAGEGAIQEAIEVGLPNIGTAEDDPGQPAQALF